MTLSINAAMNRMAEHIVDMQSRSVEALEVLRGPLETEIAGTPHEIVYEEDRVKLKYYRPPGKIRTKHPLLIVYAQINRETMLDLQPERSVIRHMLERGMEIYMVDWGYPTRKDRFLSIDDYVNGYMHNIVEFICRRHKINGLNIMGICMGGTFSVIYAALHPEKVKNLVTTVTPTNFDTDQGLLHIWMKAINPDRLVDTFGNIPGDFLNFGFLMLNPARLIVDKYIGFMENMNDRIFVENFVRMEKWIFDSPDLTGEAFRQFITDCYQKNLLIKNQMMIGEQRVDLKKITMPVLNIYGKFDHLVPPGACQYLTREVGSEDVEDICLETGHIGIYVSAKCQDTFAPKIVEWLEARDGRRSGDEAFETIQRAL
jgi:polyhydroxyalkanoate synthase subunit PhaC